jgi:hypothetical protein
MAFTAALQRKPLLQRFPTHTMKVTYLPFALVLLFITGCTSVTVQRVPPTEKPITMVYIQRNTNVEIEDFVGVLQDAFAGRGIATKVVTTEPIPPSAYFLTYTAQDGWDLASFLKHAELRLKQGTRLVGSATYHHHGGFAFNKFASNKSKITPVVDELLSDARTR